MSENVEYKSQMLEDLYKEVIAFTNTDGGVIYIGIDDQGNLTGIDDVDETYTRLTNGIRDAIQPDVTMFVRYVLQDNKVIRIEVGEGSYKPYYLKARGLKPSGVYVRQGVTSVQASPEQIRQMIKDSDGDVFEEMRTMEQGLTFDHAEKAFECYGMEFISIGGLLPGLSPKDIRNGISQPRNRKLAEIFHRLRLIESYGTGIRRIFSLYNALVGILHSALCFAAGFQRLLF